MTDQEREEFRQFNGRTILELCELGEKIMALHAAVVPCTNPDCPVSGSLHYTSECAELTRELKQINRW